MTAIIEKSTEQTVIHPAEMRERILRMEREIAQLPPVECPVKSYFCDGIYFREMTIPKNVTATGAVHKTEHATIVSKGRLLLMTDDGVQEVEAGYFGISKPGIKRAAHAIEESIITTIHRTFETDIEKLAIELTESTIDELMGGPKNMQVLANTAKEKLCLGE